MSIVRMLSSSSGSMMRNSELSVPWCSQWYSFPLASSISCRCRIRCAVVGSNKGSLMIGWGSKAMIPRRVDGTSPEAGCSMISGSVCRATSPVDPSCCVGVGSSEHRGDDTDDVTEVSGTDVSFGESSGISVDVCSISALLSLSESSIAFLKS